MHRPSGWSGRLPPHRPHFALRSCISRPVGRISRSVPVVAPRRSAGPVRPPTALRAGRCVPATPSLCRFRPRSASLHRSCLSDGSGRGTHPPMSAGFRSRSARGSRSILRVWGPCASPFPRVRSVPPRSRVPRPARRRNLPASASWPPVWPSSPAAHRRRVCRRQCRSAPAWAGWY